MYCVVKRFPLVWGQKKGAVLALLLALGFMPGWVAIAAPPTVQELVDQFSMTNYFNVVSNKLYTRQGMKRQPVQVGGTHHDLCRDAIYDEFQRGRT